MGPQDLPTLLSARIPLFPPFNSLLLLRPDLHVSCSIQSVMFFELAILALGVGGKQPLDCLQFLLQRKPIESYFHFLSAKEEG